VARRRELQLRAEPAVEHDERYARADEFLDVATALWHSWADDAVLDDRHSGRYADPSRIRQIDHHGKYYRVRGPLKLPRPPQGWPVLVQAGSSSTGRSFAARHAEALFTAQVEKAAAIEFYHDLKSQAAALGRPGDQIIVLPGLSPIIGPTEEEARRMRRELNELTDPSVGLARLSTRFGGHDFSGIDLDRPLSPADFPDPASNEAARSRTQVILARVEQDCPTMRQLLETLAGARGHFTSVGTPEQLADMIEDRFRSGAADGFNLMPPVLPLHLDRFIDEVVPVLQRRGLFRREYAGSTLRDHYGLDRPASRFFG
jgi:FMN-dependent oxidoreductase (nitrilotriacetate monooxygenase family)